MAPSVNCSRSMLRSVGTVEGGKVGDGNDIAGVDGDGAGDVLIHAVDGNGVVGVAVGIEQSAGEDGRVEILGRGRQDFAHDAQITRVDLASEDAGLDVVHAVDVVADGHAIDVDTADADVEPCVTIDEIVAAAAFDEVAASAAQDDVTGAEGGDGCRAGDHRVEKALQPVDECDVLEDAAVGA